MKQELEKGYLLTLGKIEFPVMPSQITMKIKGQNKTVNLIDGAQINVLKPAGLTEISFDARLPQQVYPFALYREGGFKGAKYYLDALEKLKIGRKPCQFTVHRKRPNEDKTASSELFYTNLTVSLEDYSIKEDASEGFDVIVSINLKQYVKYGTKKVKWKKKKKKKGLLPVPTRPIKLNRNKEKVYIVKEKDTLSHIALKYYGNANLHTIIYEDNKKIIEKEAKKNGRKSSSNGHYIYPGTKLKLRT